MSKYVEDRSVDDRILIVSSSPSPPLEGRHGDGPEDVAICRVHGMAGVLFALCDQGRVPLPTLKFLGVASIDGEHGRRPYLNTCDEAPFDLGADAFEGVDRVPGDIWGGRDGGHRRLPDRRSRTSNPSQSHSPWRMSRGSCQLPAMDRMVSDTPVPI